MICIIDYGAGNLANIRKAFAYLGREPVVSSDPADVRKADILVFPGVGAAGKAMDFLRSRGLDDLLKEMIQEGTPFLGVCLGMQILYESSEEDADRCLGALRGSVHKIAEGPGVKVPHIGWNQLEAASEEDPILEGIDPSSAYFYFVHSYFADHVDQSTVVATTLHGSRWPSIVRQGNVFATQFHPEKSSFAGLRLIENFLKLAS